MKFSGFEYFKARRIDVLMIHSFSCKNLDQEVATDMHPTSVVQLERLLHQAGSRAGACKGGVLGIRLLLGLCLPPVCFLFL